MMRSSLSLELTELRATLAPIFAENPRIAAAYVFGSAASGTT